MEAGSIRSIIYQFFRLVDEIFHFANLDGIPFIDTYFARFCNWTHRKD